jgi:hypothetical protein
MKRALAGLALSIAFAGATFAQTPASATSPANRPAVGSDAAAIREITIGTVVPSGQDFLIVLDERNLDRAYPEWAGPLSGAWTTFVTREQFRSVVRDVVSRRLAAKFPDGVSRDDASRMKIEIKVKLGKSPEIDIAMGC